MKIRAVCNGWESLEADATIIPVFLHERISDLPAVFNESLKKILQEVLDTSEWKAEAGEIAVVYDPVCCKANRLMFLGMGEKPAFTYGVLRGALMKALRKIRSCERIVVFTPLDGCKWCQAIVEGLVLGDYDPGEYKTESRIKGSLSELILVTDTPISGSDLERIEKVGRVIGEATNLARSLTNQPGNKLRPSQFSERVEEIAGACGLECKVFDERTIKELGMDAVLAVSSGSSEAARFIILKHWGSEDRDERPIALVGKGVTFDSGGISIKPAQSMEEMKTDKAGACAVVGAMQAIARLRASFNVVGVLPVVENLLGSNAQRPGDVVRSYSGKTIEVVNTDAEGRLILADALGYAKHVYDPQLMIDIATLTGACVVALGHIRAGLFSNDNDLSDRFLEAASRAGERFWQLPLDGEYRKELDSKIADLKNVGSRWGGAVIAAKFLEEFVDKTPWCHIDMAGMDLFSTEDSSDGPTGFGVATLTRLVLDWVSRDQ